MNREGPKPDDQLTAIVLRLEEQMNRIQEERWRKAEPAVNPSPSGPRWFTFAWNDRVANGSPGRDEARRES